MRRNNMKSLSLLAVLLASTMITPAFAETIKAQSKVDAVTVFPSGAEVTRVAEAQFAAGDHQLVFEGLPGDLMPETIRVEGDAGASVEIGSVDVKLADVPEELLDQQRRAFEKQIEALSTERARLDQVVSDAEYQKSLMQQLASGAFTAPTKDGESKSFGAQDLGQLLDLVGAKLAALSKTVTDARERQRAIDEEIGTINERIAALAPQDQQKMVVTVHLSSPAAASGSFRLKYRISEAGWQPVYDARLTSPADGKAAKLELVRRAAVTQATSEVWENVALTLSTARPVGATASPELDPLFIDGYERQQADAVSRAAGQLSAPAPASEALDEENMADKPKAARKEMVRQREAEISTAGFQALYGIPGRVSIDNTGTAKTVRIATSSLDAKLSARTVPTLDPNAYLTASFTLDGETPLLPGAVMLYRDGVFMGQGGLPLLSPGEETKLGFGVDDLIKVKRIETTRKRGEEGIISTSNTDIRAWDITVNNLHGFKIPVTVIDRMPYATREDISVETLDGMTAPTEKDFEKKRGVLAWSFELEPKAEKVIRHGFKVTWPENLEVGMNVN